MVEFDVKIDSGDLFDYMLRHTYYSMSGIVGNGIGAILVVAGIFMGKWLAIFAGAIILLYLPGTLFLKSKQQLLANPAFKEPLHYVLDEEGIKVSQEGEVQSQHWEDMFKAVSTNRSLIVYTSRMNACIFPKRCLNNDTMQVIRAISTHMPAGKVKIKQ